jgi:hypothetical protein
MMMMMMIMMIMMIMMMMIMMMRCQGHETKRSQHTLLRPHSHTRRHTDKTSFSQGTLSGLTLQSRGRMTRNAIDGKIRMTMRMMMEMMMKKMMMMTMM